MSCGCKQRALLSESYHDIVLLSVVCVYLYVFLVGGGGYGGGNEG